MEKTALEKTVRTTFSSRIFRSIVPWMAVLLLISFLFFFSYQSHVFINEKAGDIEVIIADRAEDFENRFREIKAEIAYVARFESVREALRNYPEMTAVERYHNANQISADLVGINLFNQYIEDIIIIGTNGFYKNLDSYGRLKSGIDPLMWGSIRDYTPGTSRFFFTLPYVADYYTTAPHRVFSVVFPVQENGDLLGYVQGNLSYERVIGMLRKSSRKNNVKGTVFEAITQSGERVFSENEEAEDTQTQIKQAQTKQAQITRAQTTDWETENLPDGRETQLLSGITSDEGRFVTNSSGRKLVVYRKLSESGWIFMGSIDYRRMIAPVYREALVLALVVLPLSVLLMSMVIFFLARQIQRPVERLKNRVENADIETYMPSEETYEISEVQVVADRFEESMQRNQNLIRRVYEEELLRKDAELEVLRNQITPHFIYNSLQLIKTEAVLSGNREISRSVNALAGLLRYSMDSGTDTVRLEEEIEYIGNYLEIYKRRYVDRFAYEILAEGGQMKQIIPKMILQPLVENSIRHGLAETKSGGLIRVTVLPEEGDGLIRIRVEDNGCGVTEERRKELEQALRETSDGNTHGIGVLNVHRRIRLQCGEGTGILELGNCPEGGFYQIVGVRPHYGNIS